MLGQRSMLRRIEYKRNIVSHHIKHPAPPGGSLALIRPTHSCAAKQAGSLAGAACVAKGDDTLCTYQGLIHSLLTLSSTLDQLGEGNGGRIAHKNRQACSAIGAGTYRRWWTASRARTRCGAAACPWPRPCSELRSARGAGMGGGAWEASA